MSKLDDFIADEKLTDFVRDVNPAQAYLDSLAPSGRHSQDHALRVIAGMMGFEHWADVPWGELRYNHTRKIQTTLIKDFDYAPRTLRRMIAALRGVLKEAWRQGLINSDEYHRAVDLGKIKGGDELAGRMLSFEEIKLFYQSCLDGSKKGYRDAAIFALLRLGLRLKEVASLKMEDFYFQKGELFAFRIFGKGAKTRILPIDGQVREALDAWLRIRGEEQQGFLFWHVRKDDILIRKGLAAMSIYNMLIKRQRELAMTHWTPHDMRRTMISEIIDYSDVSIAQGLAGHSSAAMTAKYDRRPTSARREAIKHLNLY